VNITHGHDIAFRQAAQLALAVFSGQLCQLARVPEGT